MNHVRLLLVFLMAAMLSACSGFYAKPKTLEQSLFHAEAQVLAAYRSLEDVVDRKKITRELATKRKAQIDEADATLGVARSALAEGDIATAEGKLNAALALLLALEKSNE